MGYSKIITTITAVFFTITVGYGQTFLDLSTTIKEGVNRYAVDAGATKAPVWFDSYSNISASIFSNGSGGYNVRVSMPSVNLQSFEFELNGKRAIGHYGTSLGSYTLEDIEIEIHEPKTGYSQKHRFSINGTWGKHKQDAFTAFAFSGADVRKAMGKVTTLTTEKAEYDRALASFKIKLINKGRLTASSFPTQYVKQYLKDERQKALKAAPEKKNIVSGSGGTTSPGTGLVLKSSSSSKTNKTNSPDRSRNVSGTSGRKDGGKTLEQIAYEREAYQRQQQIKIQQAVDPTRQAMQPVRNYFDAQIDRINRERDAESAALERKLAAQKRVREAREREEAQKLEQRKQKLIATHNASQQQQKQDYTQKGGDANYIAQLNNWRAAASKAVEQVNTYLLKYKGQIVAFKTPQNNCHFVEMIENIQNSSMPFNFKTILTGNVMAVRANYNAMYQQNGYYDDTNKQYYGNHSDNFTWDTSAAQCGNYLDYIDKTLYEPGTRNFGATYKWVIKSNYDRFENYNILNGIYNRPLLFIDEVRKAGIQVVEESFNGNFTFEEKLFKNFHLEPRVWTTRYGYSFDNKKLSFGNTADSMQINIQVDKFEQFYDLKRKYAVNKVDDELDMAFFMYHTGQVDKAYSHLLRYTFMRNSGAAKNKFGNLIASDAHSDSYYPTELNAVILSVVLYMEKGDYDRALQQLDFLEQANIKSTRTWVAEHSKKAVNAAVFKLKNEIYYRAGKYDKMQLLKSKDELKQLLKNSKNIPGTVAYIIYHDLPLQAAAYIKLGNTKLAEEIYKEYKDYYYNGKYKSFYGRTIDFKAFEEASKILFPKKDIEIKQYNLVGYNVFPRSYHTTVSRYAFLSLSGFRHKLTGDVNIDLLTDQQYLMEINEFSDETKKTGISENQNLISSRQKLYAICEKTYQRGNIVKNEAYRAFLLNYIQAALMLGKIHEAIPLLADLEQTYPKRAESLHLEKNLVTLMWLHATADGELSAELRLYFGNTLPQLSRNLTQFKKLLNLWAYQKLSSPALPYLYAVAQSANAKKN